MTVAPDHAEIVREMSQYIVDFVERRFAYHGVDR